MLFPQEEREGAGEHGACVGTVIWVIRGNTENQGVSDKTVIVIYCSDLDLFQVSRPVANVGEMYSIRYQWR
jgi:hypothetical protein